MIPIKSKREIAYLRKAGELVSQTLAEVAKYIRPGVTTAELDQIAEDFIRSAGAEPAFKGYRVGRLEFPATLCISVNEVVVHGIPSDYVLQEGDIVSVDCGVRLNGYYGDSAYTFAVGDITPEKKRLLRVTREALERGVQQAIVGKRIGDISHAIQQHAESAGYGVVKELVGHGIGRKLHEEPQVPNYGSPGTGKKLREGMTLCIEPMINMGTDRVITDADQWTVRTADGKPSAHYEYMVAVQKGHPELLSTFEYIEAITGVPYQEEVVVAQKEKNGEAEEY